jgi:predicted amidophosphoribosyltransferase
MPDGVSDGDSVPCVPRCLDAATFPGGAVAGEYLTAADPRDRATHPMTCLVKRFKVDRDRDDEVADLLVRTHSGVRMPRPDVVVSAPVSQPIDRFARVRVEVAAALGARAAEVLIELLEIPGYREMSLAERRAVTARVRGGRFAVGVPWAFRGQVVLLIDDVVTSGETARCIAAALQRADAREVQLVALAHAGSADPKL